MDGGGVVFFNFLPQCIVAVFEKDGVYVAGGGYVQVGASGVNGLPVGQYSGRGGSGQGGSEVYREHVEGGEPGEFAGVVHVGAVGEKAVRNGSVACFEHVAW